ncbi:DUF192 domain-containing protein [Candidatus Margulisiibacteriota bacterium]
MKTRFYFQYKNILFIIAITFCFACQSPIFSFSAIPKPIPEQKNNPAECKYLLKHKKHTIYVVIANNQASRTKGLMHKKHLPLDQGMLFSYEQDQLIPIWMKNTYISLDIIWLDQNMQVVHIKEGTLPLDTAVIYPPQKARYVLEINAGLAKTMQLKRGAKFNLQKLKKDNSTQ